MHVKSGKLYGGPELDVSSCGFILYALLCGSLPFDDENIPNLFKKIKNGIYNLPSHLSPGARDLIPRMLLVDPLKRITIPEIRSAVLTVAVTVECASLMRRAPRLTACSCHLQSSQCHASTDDPRFCPSRQQRQLYLLLLHTDHTADVHHHADLSFTPSCCQALRNSGQPLHLITLNCADVAAMMQATHLGSCTPAKLSHSRQSLPCHDLALC